MIIIPTVQHTGTHRIAKLFPMGWTWAALNEEVTGNILKVGHINENSIENIKNLVKYYPAIIPLRHPYRVEESWKRRGKCPGEMERHYRLLINELAPLNPSFIAIDTDQRQAQLDQVNEKLGLNLETNWDVLNSKQNTYNLPIKELTPSDAVKRLAEEDFFKQYYSL